MSERLIHRRGFVASALAFTPALALAAGAKPRVSIDTGRGTIVIELEADRAPLTSANFLRYVDARRYDGGSFYRASRDPRGGSIEAGPNPVARRFPPIAHESTTRTGLRHKAGTVSLARNEPGSGTADFFICASAEPYLDAHPSAHGDNLGYAVFGEVVQGMDVVRAILAMHTSKTAEIAAMKGQMLAPPVAIKAMKRL